MTKKASGARRLVLAKGLRFDCKRCADCCHLPVTLTKAEVARYDARDWKALVGRDLGPIHEVTAHDGQSGTFLTRRADGACVFLGPDKLCEVHRHLGEPEKPLTCRAFPFTFVGGGEGGRPTLGASFACSSIASGDGEAVAARRRGLDELLEEVEAEGALRSRAEPMTFVGRTTYGRAEVERILDLLVAELEDGGLPFPQRLLAASKFTSLLAGSSLTTLARKDKGDESRDLVKAFAVGVHDQVSRGMLRPRAGSPSFPERFLFRQLLAFTVRRDPSTLLGAGAVRRAVRRVGNLFAGLSILAGNGVVSLVGRDKKVLLGDVRRSAPPADPSSPEADGALTRYFVGHLSGRTLLDPSFGVPELVPALGLLLRQYPLILLLARASCLSRGGSRVEREDYAVALRTADWTFGRIPWTSGPAGGVRGRVLADVEAAFSHVPWCAEPPRGGPLLLDSTPPSTPASTSTTSSAATASTSSGEQAR